jgi:hypothetical protein
MSADNENRDDASEYEVGYSKPPKQTRFKRGRSGNPAGRPKGSKSLKTFLMAAWDEIVTVNENGVSKQISKREAAAKQLANRAAMGDLPTIKVLAEYLAGTEDKEEDKIRSHNSRGARERVTRNIVEMSRRIEARFAVPPKSQ